MASGLPNPSGPAPERGFARAGARTLVLMLLVVTAPVLILDQLSKHYVRAHMTLYQSIAVIPHWFDITYVSNPDAAFSFFTTLPPEFRFVALVVLASIAIVVLLYLLWRCPGVTLNAVCFALILAGAAGNLIGRIAEGGRVTDFIRVHYYTHSYPVFNVADSAITVGVILILAGMILARDSSSPPSGSGPRV